MKNKKTFSYSNHSAVIAHLVITGIDLIQDDLIEQIMGFALRSEISGNIAVFTLAIDTESDKNIIEEFKKSLESQGFTKL